jgi:PAS domain S-box-containing protein
MEDPPMSQPSDALPLPPDLLGESILKAADAAGIGVSLTLLDSQVPRTIYVNDAGARILGYPKEEIPRMNAMTILAPDEQERGEDLLRRRAAGEPLRDWQPFWVKTKDGRRVPIEVGMSNLVFEGKPAVMSFFLDVSARRDMEARLLQADRLVALGTLIAGIAHEINNPLTYGHLALEQAMASLATVDLPAPVRDKVEARLKEVQQACQRIGALVGGLRSFARVETEARTAVDLAAAITAAARFVHNDLRHRGRLVTSFADVPPVRGNAAHLEQVFLNLLVNAVQGLPEDRTGDNLIQVRVLQSNDGDVVAEVEDNGVGISAANVAHIFDPFFTTKQNGAGMGLGLSICHGIVVSHGGTLSVESTPGRGSTFRVRLPAASSTASVPAPVAVEGSVTAPAEARAAGPKKPPAMRLLIVDDEAVVGAGIARAVEPDFESHAVLDVRAALEHLARHDVDLVLCDLMMPGATGMDLFAEVEGWRPDLARRFVFMTGGAVTQTAAQFLAQVKQPVVEKPFTRSALTAVLMNAWRQAANADRS